MQFEWDEDKNQSNIKKHGISFEIATKAFADPNRQITKDEKHSKKEKRLYCVGRVEGEIIMVVFTIRNGNIRIISAGNWRQGKEKYEKC